MKKIGQDYTKETLSEKLRNHAFDIIIVSMAVCLLYLMVHYKNTQKDICETKTEKVQPVQKNKPTTAIDFSNQKTR